MKKPHTALFLVFLLISCWLVAEPSKLGFEAQLREATTEQELLSITRDMISKIGGRESSPLSKTILANYSALPEEGVSRALVLQKAYETGNEDLLSIAAGVLEDTKFDEIRTWRDSVSWAGKLEPSINSLARWAHPKAKTFLTRFLASPDVPYANVGDWHTGFAWRGLQGVFAKAIVLYDSELRSDLYAHLIKQDLSESKKRTILYSMRFDGSPGTQQFLEQIVQLGSESFSKEARESRRWSTRKIQQE